MPHVTYVNTKVFQFQTSPLQPAYAWYHPQSYPGHNYALCCLYRNSSQLKFAERPCLIIAGAKIVRNSYIVPSPLFSAQSIFPTGGLAHLKIPYRPLCFECILSGSIMVRPNSCLMIMNRQCNSCHQIRDIGRMCVFTSCLLNSNKVLDFNPLLLGTFALYELPVYVRVTENTQIFPQEIYCTQLLRTV